MRPAVGEHHQVRTPLGKGLVRAVAVARQHRQPVLADQRVEQLPGGVQAPGRQDPHADRVAGQTGPQPELRLLPPAGRRILVAVLAPGQPLHRPGGLVGPGHRLLLLIRPDRRVQRLEQMREPPQSRRQRRVRHAQPQCRQIPGDRRLRTEQRVDLDQTPGPHAGAQLAGAQPGSRRGDHRPGCGTLAVRTIALAHHLAHQRVPDHLVQPAGLVPAPHVGGPAVRTAALRLGHVQPLQHHGQAGPLLARRGRRTRLPPALPARPDRRILALGRTRRGRFGRRVGSDSRRGGRVVLARWRDLALASEQRLLQVRQLGLQPGLPFLRSLQVGLGRLECALELLAASARGPPPDWLSFLARLRRAHNDRADRPILRWQACPGKVKCSAELSWLAPRALPAADRLLLRPPRNSLPQR